MLAPNVTRLKIDVKKKRRKAKVEKQKTSKRYRRTKRIKQESKRK